MIDERMEEQASLHVLGALSPAEASEFKQAMQADPELQKFVARLSTATGALAGAVPVAEPPPQLRAKILAQVSEKQKMVSLPERKKSGVFGWFGWAFAICLALVCYWQVAEKIVLNRYIQTQNRKINSLFALANELQSATNDLQRTVFALQETNRLANLRIAMLNSLVADAPKAIAVSLWDNEKQNGVLVVQNLKSLAADRDYELWVMDENQNPVAAGVFHMDESGAMRMDFKPRRLIKTAGIFAVTEEIKGGVNSPTMKNLVLASK
jgi:anti-sigma-K factor RskA